MDDLVSVIIPAYNVEKYINQCVKSVLDQTYNNLEIIIVNDGSSDDTEKICRELLLSDNRIKVISQENKGLSVARNVGYRHSHGNWIIYIDSDDWIDKTFIEQLLNLAVTHKTSIAACKSRNVDECGRIKRANIDTHVVYEYRGKEIINSLYGLSPSIRFEVWNKIWSRDLVDDVRFIEGQVSEDVHFDRLAFMKANRIVYLDTTLHNYRVQRPGNTNSSFKSARLCVFNEFELWIRELQNKGWTQEIHKMGAISCDMATNMYYEAWRTKQDNHIIERLRFEYRKFYPYISETDINRKKFKLFNMSPTLYCVVSMINRLLR